MTARIENAGHDALATGQILHGGMQRLRRRQVNHESSSPQLVSWYQLDPGATCGLHVHMGKTETWLIVEGKGIATVGEATFEVFPGDSVVTPQGTPHGLTNTGCQRMRLVNIVHVLGDAPVSTKELDSDGP